MAPKLALTHFCQSTKNIYTKRKGASSGETMLVWQGKDVRARLGDTKQKGEVKVSSNILGFLFSCWWNVMSTEDIAPKLLLSHLSIHKNYFEFRGKEKIGEKMLVQWSKEAGARLDNTMRKVKLVSRKIWGHLFNCWWNVKLKKYTAPKLALRHFVNWLKLF